MKREPCATIQDSMRLGIDESGALGIIRMKKLITIPQKHRTERKASVIPAM